MSYSRRWQNMNPYDLHKSLINEYLLTVKGTSALLKRDSSKDKRDIDVIRENHQFLWDDEVDSSRTWEKNLAKRYYDKLFKEYCVADMSRYKENKIGLRWRTEQELIDGKGQFTCGNKKCSDRDKLRTWEVNFGYMEHGIKKNALVKLRLCPDCSYKLNYHHKKKEVKRLKHNRPKSKDQHHSSIVDNIKKSESDVPDETDISETRDDKASSSKEGTEETNVWKQSQQEEKEEKSREEEFDDYLSDLFL